MNRYFYIIISISILSFSALAKKKLCVIAIHGYSEYKDLYKGKLDSCTQNGAHVIYMGLKGFGPAEVVHPASAADWIKQVKFQVALARQSCEKVTLLGNSTGGALALNHAMNESLPPYNIDGLFLINPALNSPVAKAACEGAKLASNILGPFANLGFILAEVATNHFNKNKKNALKGAVVGRSRLACSVDNISKHMMQNYLTIASPPCPQCSASMASINADTQIKSAQNAYFPKIGYNISKRMPFSLIYSRGDETVSGLVTEKLTKQPGNAIDSLHISGKNVHNQVLSSNAQVEKLRNFCCKKEFNLNCGPANQPAPVQETSSQSSSSNANFSIKQSGSFSYKEPSVYGGSPAYGGSPTAKGFSKVSSDYKKNSAVSPSAKSKVAKSALGAKGSAELASGAGAISKAGQFQKNNIVNNNLSQLRKKIVKGQKEINSSVFSSSKLYKDIDAIEDYAHIKNISRNSTQFCQLAYCPSSANSYFQKDKEISSLTKSDPNFFYTIDHNTNLRTQYKNQRSQTLKALKPFVQDIQKINLDTTRTIQTGPR